MDFRLPDMLLWDQSNLCIVNHCLIRIVEDQATNSFTISHNGESRTWPIRDLLFDDKGMVEAWLKSFHEGA